MEKINEKKVFVCWFMNEGKAVNFCNLEAYQQNCKQRNL